MDIASTQLIESIVQSTAVPGQVQAAASMSMARKSMDMQQQMITDLLRGLPAPVSLNPYVGKNLDGYA
jgi:hypothetical protein